MGVALAWSGLRLVCVMLAFMVKGARSDASGEGRSDLLALLTCLVWVGGQGRVIELSSMIVAGAGEGRP